MASSLPKPEKLLSKLQTLHEMALSFSTLHYLCKIQCVKQQGGKKRPLLKFLRVQSAPKCMFTLSIVSSSREFDFNTRVPKGRKPK